MEPSDLSRRRVWLDTTIESYRQEPSTADAKASLLLVVPSAGLAVGTGHLSELGGAAAWLGWTSFGLGLLAVVLLSAVVWPRLRGITAALDPPGFLSAAQVACDDPEQDLTIRADEAARLRRLITQKYRLLQAAILAMGMAIILASVAIILA